MKQKEPKISIETNTPRDIVITRKHPSAKHMDSQEHNEQIDVPLGKLANPVKHIGISSQNFRTITGHAGKARRFLLYEISGHDQVEETGRLDLPKAMSMHEFRGEEHPLFGLDVVITGGCGNGFIRRLSTKGVTVVATSETDPTQAVRLVAAGKPLAPPMPHDH